MDLESHFATKPNSSPSARDLPSKFSLAIEVLFPKSKILLELKVNPVLIDTDHYVHISKTQFDPRHILCAIKKDITIFRMPFFDT